MYLLTLWLSDGALPADRRSDLTQVPVHAS